MRKWLVRAGIAALVGVPAAASAQTVPLRAPPTDKGPLSPFGKTLDDMGIRIRSQLVNEFAANPVGGVDQGHTDVGQFQLGASFNLDTIVGWKGAQFHITFVRDFGNGLSHDLSGTFIKCPIQKFLKRSNTLRFAC